MSPFTFSSKLLRRVCYYRTLFFGRRCIRMDNKTPLISFTFDDFPRSALYSGGAMLRDHGLAATYYTSLGLMNTDSPVGRIFSEEDLREVLSQGHELGCHTFDHCHAWDTPPKEFEESILRNRRALSRLIPGTLFSTLSYPRAHPRPQTKRKAGKYFLGCRGGCQTLNSGTADLNNLKNFFLEQSRGDAAVVKALIDRNCRCGGWLIFATHDIADNPSRFGCKPGFFKDIVQYSADSGATILPIAAALKKVLGPSI